MKLLIVTPAIKASAIGRMTCLVTHALLEQHHDVIIVRAECEALLDRPTHNFNTRIISWNNEAQVREAVANCDIVVYQIGDNFRYHEGCVTWLARVPGIVCLHDFFIGHLFSMWAEKNMENASSILKHWYGDAVAARFFSFPSSDAFIEDSKNNAPLTEWIASQALGVITHSHWGTRRVIRACSGRVRVVPLAYDAPCSSALEQNYVPNKFGRMKLLTIGHINRNKRAASVIRAIASSPLLRQNVSYRLVGHINTEMTLELSTLAASLRVNLVISGEVDDAELAHSVGEADVMSCLRWPSLEAASASAIEAMLYGKATIVTNTGFYREIPDDCVEKTPHDGEVTSLRNVLEHLYINPVERIAMGERARRWALSSYSADNYAKQLVAEGVAYQKSRPATNAKAFFVTQMKSWGASDALLRAEGTVLSLAVMDQQGDSAKCAKVTHATALS